MYHKKGENCEKWFCLFLSKVITSSRAHISWTVPFSFVQLDNHVTNQWDSVVTTDIWFKRQRTFCLRAFASLVGFCCSLSAKRNHLVKWLCLCVLLWDTEIIFPTPANKNEQLSLFNQWKEAAAANTCKPLQVFLFLFCFAFQFFNLFSQTPAESSLGCNP